MDSDILKRFESEQRKWYAIYLLPLAAVHFALYFMNRGKTDLVSSGSKEFIVGVIMMMSISTIAAKKTLGSQKSARVEIISVTILALVIAAGWWFDFSR